MLRRVRSGLHPPCNDVRVRVPWPTWRAIYRPQQKRQRMVRMRPLLLPAFLAFTAAVLPPNASIGQDAGFGRDADVHVREDSFACKETSELDRLLQRNQSGGFTSGVQLYECRTRARVRDTRAVRLHLRSERQE